MTRTHFTYVLYYCTVPTTTLSVRCPIMSMIVVDSHSWIISSLPASAFESSKVHCESSRHLPLAVFQGVDGVGLGT